MLPARDEDQRNNKHGADNQAWPLAVNAQSTAYH